MDNRSTIRDEGRRLGTPYRLFGRLVCAIMGWTPVGSLPEARKAIFIASPHTSNWDGFIMLACAWSLGVRLSWMTKHSLFKWPFHGFLRSVGAVPVNRSKATDTVQQIADQFKATDEMYLAIAPSGTRSRREMWRSGFYHMALAADIPIICGFLDYRSKRGGVGALIEPTGDVTVDMDRIRAAYAGIQGKHAALHTPIRLRAEMEGAEMEGAEAAAAPVAAPVAAPADNATVPEPHVATSAEPVHVDAAARVDAPTRTPRASHAS
jgi:1-acyl-sn-glycerol-3-phosphate acyltransferase